VYALRDIRRVSYIEYGDPEGVCCLTLHVCLLRSRLVGSPVFYLGQSRLEPKALDLDAAKRLGVCSSLPVLRAAAAVVVVVVVAIACEYVHVYVVLNP
jgi:hypothetical protein